MNIELQERILWYYEFQPYRKERKPCLHRDIYGFLVFPPKFFDTSRCIRILENSSDSSYCHINSNTIGLI
jgi:hypothetical protein